MAQHAAPTTKWWNFFERVLWTLLQAASATGLLAIWESIQGPIHDEGTRALVIIVLTTLLAAIKNAAAQVFGNGSGATLPASKAPVPAEDVVVTAPATDPDAPAVAWTGSSLDNGLPVQVTPAA